MKRCLDPERPKVMGLAQAEQIRERACTSKVAMGQRAAQAIAATEPKLVAYRCCFCAPNWHVGHLGMAIRVLAQQ